MNQYQIDSYFLLAKARNKEIAKSKDLNFANNIGDYMFMHRTQDKLFFKNRISRKYYQCNY